MNLPHKPVGDYREFVNNPHGHGQLIHFTEVRPHNGGKKAPLKKWYQGTQTGMWKKKQKENVNI